VTLNKCNSTRVAAPHGEGRSLLSENWWRSWGPLNNCKIRSDRWVNKRLSISCWGEQLGDNYGQNCGDVLRFWRWCVQNTTCDFAAVLFGRGNAPTLQKPHQIKTECKKNSAVIKFRECLLPPFDAQSCVFLSVSKNINIKIHGAITGLLFWRACSLVIQIKTHTHTEGVSE